MNLHQIYKALGFFPVLFTLALLVWSEYVYLSTVMPTMYEQGTKRTIVWTFIDIVLLGLALWSYAVCVARNPGNPSLRNPTVFSHGGTTPFIRIASSTAETTVRQRSGSVSSRDQTGSAAADSSDDSDDSDIDIDSSDEESTLTSAQLQQTQLIHTMTVKHNGQPRFCLKCNAPKPDRAHHCSTCNVCVLKMDHHCPWLNNCVGFRTQKAFILFLAYTALYAGTMAVTTFIYYVMHVMDMPSDFPFSLSALFMMMLAAAFFVCLLCFGGFHVYLMLTNQTTIETYGANTFRHTLSKDVNLFSLGWRRNFTQVFGHKWPLWFVPVFTSAGDGIRYPVDFDCYDMNV
ncbi:Palmitoyltransferase zdhhc15 [Coemansia erecta]|nr:Palmitoyltransferase zdhhc15 [Coemansia sp. RSA 2618]KAJ2827918.1 Palmitoyltransferase zdhhc15 [Coemansia erecta]